MTENTNGRLRKYYWLSLLALIPGFGIFIGIYLLIYSSIKFRKLKLALLIVGCIIINIIIIRIDSYYMGQEMKYGQESNNGFKYLSQVFLDSLQAKVEIYKDYSGDYPDSLMELKKIFPTLIIEDPLLEANDMGTGRKNYYYLKKGDTYTLFSSGIDRIPYTKDDLYPRRSLKTRQSNYE